MSFAYGCLSQADNIFLSLLAVADLLKSLFPASFRVFQAEALKG